MKKMIIKIVKMVFNHHMRRYGCCHCEAITEQTNLGSYPFDDLDKTMIVVELENELGVFLDDVDCFADNSSIDNIADAIENKLNGKSRRLDRITKDARTLAEAIYERNNREGLYEETYVNRNLKNIEEEIKSIENWLKEEMD